MRLRLSTDQSDSASFQPSTSTLASAFRWHTRSRESTRLSPFGPSRSSRMSRTSRVKENMRAVKGRLGHSFKEMGRELEKSRSTDAYHNVQPGDARILGFLGVISVRMVAVGGLTCDIERKEAYLEQDETHCRNYRDCSDRSPDRILCEGERRRIWWRIFERFKRQWLLREHGQPWITHL